MPPITKDQRVLVFANYLAKPRDQAQRYRRLYEFIEASAPLVVRSTLTRHYGRIHELIGGDCTRARFVSLLQQLTGDSRTRAVDVFLQLHGLKDGRMEFAGGEQVPADQLASEVLERVTPGRLRLVYTTNCWGAPQVQALLGAGFMAGVGSVGINANAGTEFQAFCRVWSTGVSVAEVVRRADRDVVRAAQDAVAKALGFPADEVDSKKIVHGDANVTIRTAPRSGASRQTLLDDTVQEHKRRRGSRQHWTLNDRTMQSGCIVRAVNLVRVNDQGVVVDGPSREVVVDALRRGGASIQEDGVGTRSLRVRVVSWNSLLTTDVRFRVAYTVDGRAGAMCAL